MKASRTAAALLLSLLIVPFALAEEAAPEKTAEQYIEELKKQAVVQQQHRALLANQYFESGKKRFDERRFEEAEQDFESCVAADPNHADGKNYLERTRRILGKTGGGGAALPGDEVVVRQGFQLAQLQKLLSDAKEKIAEGDFQKATENLRDAQNLAKLLSIRTDVSREKEEIAKLLQEATAAKENLEKTQQAKAMADAQAVIEAEHQKMATLHQERIQRMVNDAKARFDETRYLLCAKKCDEVLKLEPRNKEVLALRERSYQLQAQEDVKWFEKAMDVETAATWRETRKLAIPFSDVNPLYPDDWDQKKIRTAAVDLEPDMDETELEWRKKLDEALKKEVSFEFVATPLDDVIVFFRNFLGINIVVDRTALKDQQLDVSLTLSKVTFKEGLAWICKSLELSYAMQDGVIFISTAEAIGKSQEAVTKFYDVTDLTIEIRDFKPDLQAISNNDIGDDAGIAGDIFGGDDLDEDGENSTFTGDSLVEFIKAVIAPGSWAELGGGGGGGFGF